MEMTLDGMVAMARERGIEVPADFTSTAVHEALTRVLDVLDRCALTPAERRIVAMFVAITAVCDPDNADG